MKGGVKGDGFAVDEFDANFAVGNAVGLAEFFGGYGAGGVDAALVDPGLEAVEI